MRIPSPWIVVAAALLAGALTAPSAQATVQQSSKRSILFSPRGETVSAGVSAVIDRVDPATGNWRSEVLHDLAKPRIERFVKQIGRSVRRAKFGEDISSQFSGLTALRPERLETVSDDGTMRVRIGRDLSDARHNRESLSDVVSDLVSDFQESRIAALGTSTKIASTDLDPLHPDRFTTRVLVTLDGNAKGGGKLQINMDWDVSWRVEIRDRRESALIRSVELKSYEDIRVTTELFADISARVFRAVPRFGPEFLRGTGAFYSRTDSGNESFFAGQFGIAVGDLNGDGLEDIFVPQHGGLANRVLLHEPDGTVRDVSEESGLALIEETVSALILDIDNDGDQDVVMAGTNTLVVGYNDGKANFTLRLGDGATPTATGQLMSLAAADWDLDGDLDIYACVYAPKGPLGSVPVPFYDARNGPANCAWRNNGDGTWTDVTAELGLDHNNDRFSYAAIWDDFDSDGDLDLYVVNDFGTNNFYRNDGGRFVDVAEEVGAESMSAGMGVSAGDIDNDGDIDIYVTNMWSSAGRRVISQTDQFMSGQAAEIRFKFEQHVRGNALLLNRGDGTFEDATETSGATNANWAWGAMMIDINNDGLEDIYSPNGFLSGAEEEDL